MKFLVLGVVLFGACSRAPDLEMTGDVAWRTGKWSEAMTAYRNAGEVPRIVAKYADAAYRGGFLPEAVMGWRQLAQVAPGRSQEAAVGLIRVALTAERQRDQVVLASAVAALRVVAPDWPAGRLVRHLQGDRGLKSDEASELWPVMAGAAPDAGATVQALMAMGRLDTERGDCDNAIADFQSAARRSDPPLRDTVFSGMAQCELKLGLAALNESHDGDAERWFGRAIMHDPLGGSGRRALVGFGDARLKQGDLASALIAWRTVVTAPVAADSVFDLALQRLQSAMGPDSTVKVPGWH